MTICKLTTVPLRNWHFFYFLNQSRKKNHLKKLIFFFYSKCVYFNLSKIIRYFFLFHILKAVEVDRLKSKKILKSRRFSLFGSLCQYMISKLTVTFTSWFTSGCFLRIIYLLLFAIVFLFV